MNESLMHKTVAFEKLMEIASPTGEPLTREDLPPPDTKRWVIRRKGEVVAGVRMGLLTLEEALEMYNLSLDEFVSWQKMFEEHGLPGLRTTMTKKYRDRARGRQLRVVNGSYY